MAKIEKSKVIRVNKKALKQAIKDFNELDVPEGKREIYNAIAKPLKELVKKLI